MDGVPATRRKAAAAGCSIAIPAVSSQACHFTSRNIEVMLKAGGECNAASLSRRETERAGRHSGRRGRLQAPAGGVECW